LSCCVQETHDSSGPVCGSVLLVDKQQYYQVLAWSSVTLSRSGDRSLHQWDNYLRVIAVAVWADRSSCCVSRIISSVHSRSEIATISTNVHISNVLALSKNLGLAVRFSISIPGNVFIGAQESFHDLARAADG
jgi:hypothetical protein